MTTSSFRLWEPATRPALASMLEDDGEMRDDDEDEMGREGGVFMKEGGAEISLVLT